MFTSSPKYVVTWTITTQIFSSKRSFIPVYFTSGQQLNNRIQIDNNTNVDRRVRYDLFIFNNYDVERRALALVTGSISSMLYEHSLGT